ncbi:MAG: Asp-tRNA(Asn)/Glu-tRNA(Gln) amidotransferase subunit GatC [Proteobacteria bacterium]|nr:Asp-tRNA(Asn)/Glu-tRNA(Gln) amidotransferase subunit GatC [Pseudomonadota bacterium]
MSLDKATVAKIARLARIKVPDGDLDALAGELSKILDWIEQLNEVDTRDVPPMTHVAAMKLKWRQDEVTGAPTRDDLIANAPEERDGFFAVPKVLE